MIKKLNRDNVGEIPVRPQRIIQFGQGNFLRAFPDWVVQHLNDHHLFHGDIVIIKPRKEGSIDDFIQQDCLYHVIINGLFDGKPFTSSTFINCIQAIINPYEDSLSFFNTAKNPDMRIVISNTTEAGITFDGRDKNSDIISNSFPGKLTQWLWYRFVHFKGNSSKGMVILPCELIEENGKKLKEIVLQYIRLWNLSKDFETWISNHNYFCNTLVDRIVPGFPEDRIKETQKQLGYEDNLIVSAEPFHLWVIEGPKQARNSFPIDNSGLNVKFVDDLQPFRTRKVRILNGAHTALVPVAFLHGLRTVKESVEDEFVGSFISEAIFQEIIPTLQMDTMELEQFARDVMDRFRNPYIKHELSSIALNAISKFTVRVLPTILDFYKKNGRWPQRLIFSLACLIRFYKGTWKQESLPVKDSEDVRDFLQQAWKISSTINIVEKVLENTDLWGQNLLTCPELGNLVTTYLVAIETHGSIKTAFEQTIIDNSF